jgi:hypothetical protein
MIGKATINALGPYEIDLVIYAGRGYDGDYF